MTTTAPAHEATEDAYPLAAMQAGMLYQSLYQERTAAYHDVLSLTLRGRFDRAALECAAAELVSRHAALRTAFDLTTFSEPVALVRRAAVMPLRVVDLAGRPDARAVFDAWRAEEQFQPYDLGLAPLARFTVHLLPENTFALTISFHHAILDGWSVASLVTELLARYRGLLTGAPVPATPLANEFAEFIAAERAAIADPATEEFWRATVAGSNATRLLRDPGPAAEGEQVARLLPVEIAPALLARVEAVAAGLDVPLRSVLLAAHLRVLSLLSGEADVLTGTVTHGRPETETGAELLGLFLNTVPVRLTLDQDSWRQLVLDTHDRYVSLLPHRRFPMVEIQRLAGRSPLFETAFDYRHFHVYDGLDSGGPVTLLRRDHLETTDVPFAAAFFHPAQGGLVMLLSYDAGQFPADQIDRVARYYLDTLAELAADPGADPRTGLAALRADAERIAGWNATGSGRESTRPLHAMVAAGARRHPDAPAVIDGTAETSYAALWARTRAIAGELTAAGVGAESVVAVGVPRSAEAIAAMLAVLQAGGAVLPLDLDHPDARLRELIDSAGAVAVLTTSALRQRFPGALLVDTIPDHAGEPLPAREVSPEALAFLLFTSGSTGRPKGVMLTHHAAMHYLDAAVEDLELAGLRVAQRSTLSVDAAVSELGLSFAGGGAAVIVPTESIADPESFVTAFAGAGINVTVLVPSLIAPLAEAGAFGRCPDLGTVISVGERLPRPLATAVLAQSELRLYNGYGPTEAGIGLTKAPVTPDGPDGSVPIGGPSRHVRLHILDRHGRPAPIGSPGEVFVAARQLARGYYRQPGLTARQFVPDHLSGLPGARLYRTGDRARWLPDGQLDFLGRVDGQLKIRGVRTEPGEIEAELARHPLVNQVVVAAVAPAGNRPPVLVAYLTWTGDERAETAQLRDFLADRLPRALVPTVYIGLERFGTLPNGKVDRAALPAPELGPALDQVAPRDPVESTLATLWAEALDVPSIGIRDDFFLLGGDSLRALRLVMRVRKEFGRELAMDSLLSRPTIEQFARVLRSPDNVLPAARIVPLHRGLRQAPVFFLHGLGGQVFGYQRLAQLLGEDRPVYAIPALGFRDGEQPHATLEAMAGDYAQRIMELCPEGPVLLGGFCIGGNIAVEVGRRLRAAGREVPLVTAFWSHADNPISAEVYDDASLMMFALADGSFEIDREHLATLDADAQLLAIVAGAAQAGELNPAVTDLDQARRILRVYRANATALSRYAHQPYDGDMVLLKPVEDPFAPDDDFHWKQVVRGEFRMLPIPGSAADAVDEPQVSGAAAVLRGLIDHVQ